MKKIFVILILVSCFAVFARTISSDDVVSIKLKDDTIITGNLSGYSKKYIFVSKEKTLYSIELLYVTEALINNEHVELSEIFENKFKKLNYNRYLNFVEVDENYFSNKIIQDYTKAEQKSITFDNKSVLLMEAGNDLKKFSTYTYLGIVASFAGAMCLNSDDKNTQDAGIYISIGGVISSLIAPHFVAKAGSKIRRHVIIEQNSKDKKK